MFANENHWRFTMYVAYKVDIVKLLILFWWVNSRVREVLQIISQQQEII